MLINPPALMPQCRGIFVGGCVVRGEGSSFRAQAHSHNHPIDPHFGWLCVRSLKRVYDAKGEFSRLIWHEYAHLLAPKHSHDDAWRLQMKALRQPLPARYKKQKRGSTIRHGRYHIIDGHRFYVHDRGYHVFFEGDLEYIFVDGEFDKKRQRPQH